MKAENVDIVNQKVNRIMQELLIRFNVNGLPEGTMGDH
jgi:hypothetical protein